MPSLKLTSAFASTILLVLIATLLRNELMLYSSIPLFAYSIFLLFFHKDLKLDLEVKRTLSKEMIGEDDEVEVKIAVKNNGEEVNLYLEDFYQKDAKLIAGSNAMLMRLKKGESKVFSYWLKVSEIGKYRIGPLEVIAFNDNGSALIRRSYEIYSNFKVSPKVSLFGEIKLKPRYTKPWPGESASRALGIGSEFYSLIEVPEGEVPRRINWKATAKTGKLMKNVYHAELGSDILIILDYRAVNDVKFKDKSLLLYSARAALLLAYRLLRDRHRVGLLIIAEEPYRLLPSFGRRQFERILYSVLEAEPGKLFDLRLLKDYVSFMFPITTEIIFISPVLDSSVPIALAELSKRGYRITCIAPRPLEARIEGSLVDKLLFIERENYLSLIRSFARLLEWDVNRALDLELKKASEMWSRSRT